MSRFKMLQHLICLDCLLVVRSDMITGVYMTTAIIFLSDLERDTT